MIDRTLLKQALVVVSSGSSGFYVGGRYVGGLAISEYIGEQPAWLGTAQQTMWTVLALGVLCIGLWIVMDYSEHNE
jgi:hypothetical protein